MDTVIGIIELIVAGAVVARFSRKPQQHPTRPGRPSTQRAARRSPVDTPRRPQASAADQDDQTMDGWMIGHVARHGHHDFPGDPLPGGHLGSARDLGFWAGLSDEDGDVE